MGNGLKHPWRVFEYGGVFVSHPQPHMHLVWVQLLAFLSVAGFVCLLCQSDKADLPPPSFTMWDRRGRHSQDWCCHAVGLQDLPFSLFSVLLCQFKDRLSTSSLPNLTHEGKSSRGSKHV